MTPEQQRLSDIGRRYRDILGNGITSQRQQRQRADLLVAAAQDSLTPTKASWGGSPRMHWVAAVALVFICGIAAVVALLVRGGAESSSSPVRSFSIEHDGKLVEAKEGAQIDVADQRGVALRFAGGSHIKLWQGSSARVERSRSGLVRVRIRHGRLEARVNREPGTRWSVLAGMYDVRVVGTRFTVVWDDRRAALQVEVRRGSVQVVGPGALKQGLTVTDGQTLLVDKENGWLKLQHLADGQQRHRLPAPSLAKRNLGGQPDAGVGRMMSPARTPQEGASRTTTPSRPTPPSGEPGRAPSAASRPPSAAKGRADSLAKRWAALVRHAKHQEIVQEANKHGFRKLLLTLPEPLLMLLANACRYTRRGTMAVQALSALRRRFPATPRAQMSAYLLGRIYLELLGHPRTARSWFLRYLKSHPTGSLAEEALARLIVAYQQEGNLQRARETAKDYLKRFPNGAFHKRARAILKGPANPSSP